MSTVWRTLPRALVVALALPLIVVLLYAYGRLTSPTASQREALATMQARGRVGDGENGFLILMAAAVPDGPWPAALSCRDEGAACLDAVQSAPEAHEAALSAHAAALDTAERALRAPVFHDPDATPQPEDRLPPFQWVTRLPARRAFDFLAGREAEALESACRDAGDLARWSRQQDSLIHAMIAVAGFRQYAALIAEMRARSPSLPRSAACDAVSEPPDAALEGTVCESMRGEWRWIDTAGERVIDEVHVAQRAVARWLHSPAQFSARNAERLAGFCGPAAETDAERDVVDLMRLDVPARAIDRLSFPVSALLSEIAGPTTYADYAERQLDHVAMRRLLAAFLQMEAMDAGLSNAERFAALPAALRDGPRPLVFDAAEGSIAVPLRSRRYEQGGNVMRLRLPERAEAQDVSAPEPSMPR